MRVLRGLRVCLRGSCGSLCHEMSTTRARRSGPVARCLVILSADFLYSSFTAQFSKTASRQRKGKKEPRTKMQVESPEIGAI